MVLTKVDFQKTDFSKKKIFPEKKKENRRAVFILFFGTIILSGVFWMQAKFKDIYQNFFKPMSFRIVKPTGKSLEEILGFKPNLENKENLKKSINFLIKDMAGIYGIYFYELENKESLGVNQDQVFIAASVNKLPIIIHFYQQVEQGTLKEDEEYALRRKDIQDYGTGQMRYQPIGTKYKYSQLIELAGRKSDNTAAYVLTDIIGKEKIQINLNKLGMKNTSMEHNKTTPKEMAGYLIDLYNDNLVSNQNKEKIFSVLTETDFEDRIPKGIPDNIKVANKIGNEIGVCNDCGIVFASKPYVLCILTKEIKESEALEALPKISRLIWEFVNK